MQDNSDLRNLVLQTLDSKGILSHLKAQVRANVYSILENQDESLKKNAGFALQNPVCQKLVETPEGQNILDLINEFLLFFKMDYTQSVYIKETNLAQNITRDKLVRNLALKENIDPDKPVLMHIVNQYLKGMVGGLPSSSFQQPTNLKKGIDMEDKQKNNKKNEPVEEKNTNLFTKKGKESPILDTKNEKKNESQKKKPEENKIMNKFGNFKAAANDPYSYDIPDDNKDLFSKKPAANTKKEEVDDKKMKFAGNLKFNNAINKNDENSELIEEELAVPEEEFEEEMLNQNTNKKQNNPLFTSSEDIIGMSQSQGIDNSVTSSALEGYDYFEEIEKKQTAGGGAAKFGKKK